MGVRIDLPKPQQSPGTRGRAVEDGRDRLWVVPVLLVLVALLGLAPGLGRAGDQTIPSSSGPSSSGPSSSGGQAELVMFEAEGCGWCAAWHREVGESYPLTAEGKRLPLRRVDLHGDRPPDLTDLAAPVVFTPTFVVLRDGKEVGRITGYAGENFFWALLAEIIETMQAEEVSAQ